MRLAAILLLTLRASAAVLQGIVLDEETGNPLARASVVLVPLPGTEASTVTIRSGDRGTFSILSVRPGWYVLSASRRGYADSEAGQRRAGRPGMPFEVLADTQSTFFQMRMKRLAAITGTLLDENNVGLPDLPVHIYTGRKPVRRVAEGKTDDRGVFRVGGLHPGTYVVRSGPGLLEDNSSVVPAYYKFGAALETAERVTVRLGETQQDVVIRPQKGRLITLSGIVTAPPSSPVRLTLITDTGRRLVTSSAGPFEAANVPPGPVELVVEGTECGSYNRLAVDRDIQGLRVSCNPLYRPTMDWRVRDMPKPALQFPILARRVDLDGASQPRLFRSTDPVLPGHYELMVQTDAQYYAQAVRTNFGQPSPKDDGWFGVDFGNQARLQISLSDTPAAITGTVTTSGKAVAGAIIYLELFTPNINELRQQLWTGRTDHTGRYSFTGLTPGRYRLLSTFDFDPEDRFAMESGKVVAVKDGEVALAALELVLH